jgi:hypothetical protein
LSNYIDTVGADGQVQRVPIENTAPMRNGDDARDVRRLVRSAAGKRASAYATADLVASLADGGTPMMRENAMRVLGELDIEEAREVSEPQIYIPASAEEPAPVAVAEPVAVVTDYHAAGRPCGTARRARRDRGARRRR